MLSFLISYFCYCQKLGRRSKSAPGKSAAQERLLPPNRFAGIDFKILCKFEKSIGPMNFSLLKNIILITQILLMKAIFHRAL